MCDFSDSFDLSKQPLRVEHAPDCRVKVSRWSALCDLTPQASLCPFGQKFLKRLQQNSFSSHLERSLLGLRHMAKLFLFIYALLLHLMET